MSARTVPTSGCGPRDSILPGRTERGWQELTPSDVGRPRREQKPPTCSESGRLLRFRVCGLARIER